MVDLSPDALLASSHRSSRTGALVWVATSERTAAIGAQDVLKSMCLPGIFITFLCVLIAGFVPIRPYLDGSSEAS